MRVGGVALGRPGPFSRTTRCTYKIRPAAVAGDVGREVETVGRELAAVKRASAQGGEGICREPLAGQYIRFLKGM